ncbi:Uncharacterised protein [Klebsiella pneumoniae]|nr:Uncharacterised protein [Klebsiella pneumoniae]
MDLLSGEITRLINQKEKGQKLMKKKLRMFISAY